MQELRQHALAIATRILVRREDAEDVAQETMLRMMRAKLNGTSIMAQQAFAARTALRLSIDRLRSERVRAAAVGRVGAIRPAEAVPAAPPEIERLYAAIAALPPRQSAVITLRKLLELDYEDIADLLGISVENCRSHCRLALQRLRLQLGGSAEAARTGESS